MRKAINITYGPQRSQVSRKLMNRVRSAFDPAELIRICEAPISAFSEMGTRYSISPAQAPDDCFFFVDRGASILAVAHLDTVCQDRQCSIAPTAAGPVVHSGALDDRLGAYVILDMLPKLGIKVDVLLTTGEESGCSTARAFDPVDLDLVKDYRWMIEFDRMGTDVVMYQYDDFETDRKVRQFAQTNTGSFSDVAALGHLGIKGFNWGVGYHDYHGPRGYAFLEDTFEMVAKFVKFHGKYGRTKLVHETKAITPYYSPGRRYDFGSHGWVESSEDWEDWDRRPGHSTAINHRDVDWTESDKRVSVSEVDYECKECMVNLVDVGGEVYCPMCGQTYDLPQDDYDTDTSLEEIDEIDAINDAWEKDHAKEDIA